MNELGDIIACTAVFDYLSEELKDKSVFFIIDDRIELEFNQHIIYCRFKLYKVKSYYHWKLLKNILTFWFKKTIIYDLNYNGSWCYKTKKKYFLNSTHINENNYYFYGNLFTSSIHLPFSTILNSREFSKNLLKLENYDQILKVDYNRIKIIIHPLSNNKIRNWPFENWDNLLSSYDISKFQIIEIGREKSLRSNNVLHFNSTNLNQIFNLISKSDLFIGVDSSFAHVAEIFEIPSVIIIGKLYKFAYHIPYSSYYFKNNRKYLIRKNQPMEEIRVSEVKKKIEKVLIEVYVNNEKAHFQKINIQK